VKKIALIVVFFCLATTRTLMSKLIQKKNCRDFVGGKRVCLLLCCIPKRLRRALQEGG